MSWTTCPPRRLLWRRESRLSPMHGLTLANVARGATAVPLAERPTGSRTIEALSPVGASAPIVDDLLERLADAASAYALKRAS